MNPRMTKKQRAIFEAVRLAYADAGRPPTLAQIGKFAGLRSNSGVSKACAKLVEMGYLVYLGAGRGAGGGTVLPAEDAARRDPEAVEAMLGCYRGVLGEVLATGSVTTTSRDGKCEVCGAPMPGDAAAIIEDWTNRRLALACAACAAKGPRK